MISIRIKSLTVRSIGFYGTLTSTAVSPSGRRRTRRGVYTQSRAPAPRTASNRCCRHHAPCWQRAYVERLIGTLRRECLDHLIVFHEQSLYWHLRTFVDYDHRNRVHLALEKDTPEPDRSSRRSLAGSSRYRCWAGCITDTSGTPPEPSNTYVYRVSAVRSAQPLFAITES